MSEVALLGSGTDIPADTCCIIRRNASGTLALSAVVPAQHRGPVEPLLAVTLLPSLLAL